MDDNILLKIEEQGKKIDALSVSVEKMRKYFLVTMWVTVIMGILPLLALLVVVPIFLNSYLKALEGLL